jgi:CheY-like chemotaxis protein
MTRIAKASLRAADAVAGVSAQAICWCWTGAFSVFVAILFCCHPLFGETDHAVVKWAPPPKPGSIQWDADQQAAKKRQELARMRVAVPVAALAQDVPRAKGAFPVMPQAPAPNPIALPAAPTGMFSQFFLFAVVFTFALLFAVKQFAPGRWADLNRRYNPLFGTPALAGVLQGDVRAEEAAFNKFLASFRVGPSGPSQDSGARENPFAVFYQKAAKLLGEQRALFKEISQAPHSPAMQKKLVQLNYGLAALKDEAAFPEVLPVWQVASALEGLLRHLIGKMGSVNASTLRTVAGGLDLLERMCVPEVKLDFLTRLPLKFLVVDDDMISRHAMSLALKKAFGEPDLAVNGEEALVKAGGRSYDVIFLDVQMPGMDGFELCTKIREADANRSTPIIFVATQSDYEARSKSTLSGGNDLMGKPFLIFEITVKALTLALHGRLEQQARKEVQEAARAGDRAGQPVKPGAQEDQSADDTAPPTAAHVGPLRDFCRAILESSNEALRQNLLADALFLVSALISQSASAARKPTWQICTALEGLLKKMLQDAKYCTPSAVATVTAAVELLHDLSESGLKDGPALKRANILVVDDDLVTRRVIVGALQTYFTRPESVGNGEEALIRASGKPYDIIFMDLMMPGMDGFETCRKIRKTFTNRYTPVVFVTSNDDFETRSRMKQDDGNELMGKPFLVSEIMVKALTLSLRNRIQEYEMASPA